MARLFGTGRLPAFIDRITKASAETFNRYWDHFDQRLHALEELKVSWTDATAELVSTGLRRIDDIIRPNLDKVMNLTTLGFLTAKSSAERTLIEGATLYLPLDPGIQQELFTPTPFLAITREGDVNDWAVARLLRYDVEIGELQVEILHINGNAGPHDDWVVSASAGVSVASADAMQQSKVNRDQAVQAAIEAKAAALLIAGGPVSSVNGKFGHVDLRANEIMLSSGEVSIEAELLERTTVLNSGLSALASQKADKTTSITAGVGLSGGGNLSENLEIAVKFASKPEAEAGTATDISMDPFRTAQAIAAISGGYQEFLSSGTFIVPANARWVFVEAVGSGGGGASGESSASANTKGGGGGGGGAIIATRMLAAAILPASVPVLVAAPGLGGASTTNGVGNPGGDGGISEFGNFLSAHGGKGGAEKYSSQGSYPSASGSGGQGAGYYGFSQYIQPGQYDRHSGSFSLDGGRPSSRSDGILVSAFSGAAGGSSHYFASQAEYGSNHGGSSIYSCGGGGAGGSAAGTDLTRAPATKGGGHRSAVDGTGANVGATATVEHTGGGGGAARTGTSPGQAGGNGLLGGGGGGGGSCVSPRVSGAGGNGGAGRVRVWWGV